MFTSTFRAIAFTALALLFFSPEPALAHNVFGDMGNLTNGFLHPLTTIPHLLLLLALGIVFLVHHQYPERGILGMLMGLLLGFSLSGFAEGSEGKILGIVGMALITSMSVLTNMGLGKNGLLILSLLAGLIVGFDSEFPTATAGEFAKTFMGLSFGTTLFATIFLNIGPHLHRDWQKIALRIISSWIATISLLYLAFEVIGVA